MDKRFIQSSNWGTDKIRIIHPDEKGFSYTAKKRRPELKKHNRIIIFLKLFMPSFAVVAIALMILWPKLVEQKADFKVGLSSPLLVARTDNLSIVNFKYVSSDSQSQPFSLMSDLAVETEQGSRIINLVNPKAEIELNSGMKLNTGADKGILYQKDNKIILQDNFIAFSDKGHRLSTDKVTILLNDSSLRGNNRTFFTFPQGNIESEGIVVMDRGDIVKFTGKAKMILKSFSKQGEVY